MIPAGAFLPQKPSGGQDIGGTAKLEPPLERSAPPGGAAGRHPAGRRGAGGRAAVCVALRRSTFVRHAAGTAAPSAGKGRGQIPYPPEDRRAHRHSAAVRRGGSGAGGPAAAARYPVHRACKKCAPVHSMGGQRSPALFAAMVRRPEPPIAIQRFAGHRRRVGRAEAESSPLGGKPFGGGHWRSVFHGNVPA